MDPIITIQLFTGGFLGRAPSWEEIKNKLTSILSVLPVDNVIMGWSLSDKSLYEKAAAFLAQRCINLYLWFPVFSETGVFGNLSPLSDLRGRKLNGSSGQGEEDFVFCCPNNPENTENILSLFDREFSFLPFSGIFLDKIRFPSFAQGGVFTCFCPWCLEKYREENFDPLELKEALAHNESNPPGIMRYNGCGGYSFRYPVISRFFSLKSAFILQSIKKIAGYFRERNYKIGLDVFAPFLSPFVGQDLAGLSGLGDFIKPMMYRLTKAPAGLPFELEALISETRTERSYFHDLLGIDGKKEVFDLDFTVRELKGLTEMSSCPVYAGLEINHKENLAEAHPDYIEETMLAYESTGVQGFVLSWDLLDAPPLNIDAAANALEKINHRKKAVQKQGL